jgi:phage pi2 protein 07
MRKTREELDNLTGYDLKGIDEDVRYTYEEMTNLVNKLEDQGIKEMMLSCWNSEDIKINLDFIKQYNYKKEKE